jgi:putative FmdB family regulatory protein
LFPSRRKQEAPGETGKKNREKLLPWLGFSSGARLLTILEVFMPTYEYQCDACNYRFEEFQWMKEEPLQECPECRKRKLRRLFGSGAAILFKGSGFYQTDYRSESYKAAAKAERESKKEGTGTGTTANNGTTGNPAQEKTPKTAGKSKLPSRGSSDD